MFFCGSVLERKMKTDSGYLCAENLGFLPVSDITNFPRTVA